MKASNLTRFSLVAGAALALTFVGCTSGSSPATSGSAAPAVSQPGTTASPTPKAVSPGTPTAGKYAFFKPGSEQDLIDNTNYGYVIVKADAKFDPANFGRMGFTVAGSFTMNGVTYYHLYHAGAVLPSLGKLQATRGVLFAHPDMRLKPLGGITYDNPDPLTQAEGYSMYITHAMDAWTTYGFGPNTPYIADVDTGVNWVHEDFQKGGKATIAHAYSWWDLSQPSAGGANFITSGAPEDYVGTTIVNTDDDSHGSHTMGTIGAQGDNGKGVAGVCWQAQLISYKCFNNADQSGNSGSDWAIYGSILHLAKWKIANNITATIPMNMSLGGPYADAFSVDMIQLGLANNIVVVCAMGNAGQDTAAYPAGYEGVIAVGATDGQDQKAAFSTSGTDISVCAPGVNIVSTGNGSTSDYFIDSGTSMATPFVTGTVGYMLTFLPNLTAAEIKTELQTHADLIGGATGYTPEFGYGRVNVLNTIKDVAAQAAAGTAPAQSTTDKALQVTVMNTLTATPTPVANVPLYLYQSDAKGNIQSYVSCGFTDDFGAGAFSLLAGNYVVTACLNGLAYSTPVVAVSSSDTATLAGQTINIPVTLCQVMNDAGPNPLPYGTLQVLDGVTGAILAQDYAYLLPFTLPVVLASNHPYVLAVEPYIDNTIGEYALYVSPDSYPSRVAPGTFATPATTDGSQSQDPSNPQAITAGILYNGNLSLSGDWYSLTQP